MRSQRVTVACRLTAGVLLTFHACVVCCLIPRLSATYNEPAHICAGLACWYVGAYDMYHVNPPLPRMVATAPLLSQSDICLEAVSRTRYQPGKRNEFEIGKFFAETNAADFHRIVCLARFAGVFWITLGGLVVWLWADSLFGSLGGLLSLTLWTFEPTLTAHAALATPDVPAAVMGLVATYSFAHLLRAGTWFHAYLAGLLLGCALLCKFTLLLLAPLWFIVWLLMACRKNQKSPHGVSATGQLARVCVVALLAWLTLNAGYGFNGTGTPLNQLAFESKSFSKAFKVLNDSWASNLPSPVPTAFIRGIDTQQVDFEGRMTSRLMGESRNHGWWYYYLYAFAIKSPIGHLAIYSFALITILFRRVPIPLVLWTFPLLVVAIASSKTGFTNHLRYILPAYPFIMVISGAVMANSIGNRRIRILRNGFVAVCLLCSVASVSQAYPHLIGYFNETIGGSKEGWRHLGDSNVDWGQDWIFLRDWLAEHPNMRPIHIELINHVDKQLYLGRKYPSPETGMSGYAVIDAQSLVDGNQWLLEHPIVARIGTSIFVFKVHP